MGHCESKPIKSHPPIIFSQRDLSQQYVDFGVELSNPDQKIKKEYLVSPYHGCNPDSSHIKRHALEAALYRQALLHNPKHTAAIFNLAILIETKDITIKHSDLDQTGYSVKDLRILKRSHLAAALYEKILTIDPTCIQAMYRLAEYFRKQKMIQPGILMGKQAREKIAIYFYRKIRSLKPYSLGVSGNATAKLAFYILTSEIRLKKEDLLATRFEGQSPSHVNRAELALDLVRSVMALSPNTQAIYCLILCLDRGMSLISQDLNHTLFQGGDPEKVDRTLLRAQLEKMMLDFDPLCEFYHQPQSQFTLSDFYLDKNIYTPSLPSWEEESIAEESKTSYKLGL